MKLTTILTAIISAASSLAAPRQHTAPGSTLVHALKCGARDPNAKAAIDDFCSNGNIMVPSDYAKQGKHHGNIFVKIGGESICDPPQWVPSNFCCSQFYYICAYGPEVFGTRHFGRDKCQSFHVGEVTLAVPN